MTEKSGFNFVDIAQKARSLRPILEESNRELGVENSTTGSTQETTEESTVPGLTEMPSFFNTMPSEAEVPATIPNNPYIKATVAPNKVGIETAYAFRTKVFTVWRLWEACPRCATEIASGQVVLGAGEYVCPHTDLEEYKQTIDASLKGDLVVTSREFINVSGVAIRTVHVEWMVPDEAAQARMKRKQAEIDANWVYPPRLDLAFGDPPPKESA